MSGVVIPKRVRRNRMLTSRTLGSVRRRQNKQGNILLQEVDSGRACLNCKNCKDGFALHVWRKSCRNCFCKREDHDIDIVVDDPTAVPNMRLKEIDAGEARGPVKRGKKWKRPSKSELQLGAVTEATEEEEIQEAMEMTAMDDDDEGTAAVDDVIVEENDSPYAWIPEGLTKNQVEKFMALIPLDARPENTPEGQQKRARRRLYQLPPHDMEVDACNGLDATAEGAMKNFIQNRDERDICKGEVEEEVEIKSCAKCSQAIGVGDMSVISPRLEGKFFHPQCFVCCQCNQFLVDLIHFVGEDQLYCGRHHAELILPRCGGCDELIFTGTYTKAMDKKWHADHFCCIACDRTLAADKSEEFVQHQGNVICIDCFDTKLARDCLACEKKIGAGEEQLSSGDYQWHSACFKCSECEKVMDPSQFLMREKKLTCADCYKEKYGAACSKCKEPIDPSQRSVGSADKKWHSSCFACSACESELSGKPFVDHKKGLFCVPCYEEKHASRCKGCGKVMGKGGLRYKEDVFHESCFICSHCEESLSGKKFVYKDDKFCCQACFADKVAPKCKSCSKPISKTGDGDESFISHLTHSWHIPCFSCANCGSNLEGKRFKFEETALTCGLCK